MKKTESFFDALFGMFGSIAISFIRRLAPFIVPLAPAFFLSHAVALSAYDLSQSWSLAWLVGIVAAVGLEAAGIMASSLAVQFYTADDGKWQVAASATVVYLLIGIGAIWLLDGTSADAKTVGTAMFVIAGIVYLLLGLAEDAGRLETAVQGNADFEQEQARLRLQYAHEEKLARIQAKATAAQPAQVAATLPQAADATVAQPAQPTPAQRRVLEAIRRNPGATQAQLGEMLGISRQAVGKHVAALNGQARNEHNSKTD